jgi:hypothetical protein
MSALTLVSVFFLILAASGIVLGVAYVSWLLGSRFFGDDPGGRDPRTGPQGWTAGQFGWLAPKYVEFLREKKRLMQKNRKKY